MTLDDEVTYRERTDGGLDVLWRAQVQCSFGISPYRNADQARDHAEQFADGFRTALHAITKRDAAEQKVTKLRVAGVSESKYLTSDAAETHIVEAFHRFVEARRDMTIFGFSQFIRDNLASLGGREFIASIGKAISTAAAVPETTGDEARRTE